MPDPSQIRQTAMSSEAAAWLDANPPTPRPVITADTVDAVRAGIREGYQPAITAARAEFDVDEHDVTIAGVDCAEVRGGPRDDCVVLYFFGGGHTTGSPEEDLVVTAPIAAKLEGRVVAPRYPLAPEAPFPSALNAAVLVYRDLARRYGAERVVIAGESAGGNLALACVQQLRSDGDALPQALALLSPWGDMTHSGDSQSLDRDPTLRLDHGELSRQASLYYRDHSPDDPLISPVHADFHGFPPTLITTGTRDLLMSDCARISTSMRSVGVDVRLHLWEGMWHVFEFYRDLPEARQSMDEIADFVADHLSNDRDAAPAAEVRSQR